jgi:uncharacterized SAM-binding protein YcdF (DUF218 family)
LSQQNSNKILLVLGKNWDRSTIKSGHPDLSIASKASAFTAGKLLDLGFDIVIFSTGKTLGPSQPSEALEMSRYMRENFPNILENQIYLETKSIDTPENMKYTKQLIESNVELQGELHLVTIGFHIKRSLNLAQAWGLKINGFIDSTDQEYTYNNTKFRKEIDTYRKSLNWKREEILEWCISMFQTVFKDPRGLKQKSITKFLRKS